MLDVLARAIKQQKKIKQHPDWKGSKLSLFVDDWSCMEKILRNSLKNYLELVNKFSEVTGYSINIQKSTIFWYTHKQQSRNKITENNSTHNSIKNKYLRIDLTTTKKVIKNLHNENYKTLFKKIKEDLNKWKTSHIHGLEDFILLRWQYSPNWYRNWTVLSEY